MTTPKGSEAESDADAVLLLRVFIDVYESTKLGAYYSMVGGER